MYRAVGAHVFAGGFTRGVQQHGDFNVEEQLEIHDLGRDTVERKLGVRVVRAERWEDWPRRQCDLLYGNPRCTGFSCVTSGCGDNSHGPWSRQTKDAHDIMKYTVSLGDDAPAVVCWESVQQAYSVGKPLLDYMLEEYLAPMGYRVAHLFINAGSFGNAQQRRRYFMVAYRGHGNFNVSLPELPQYKTTLRNAIEHLESAQTRLFDMRDEEYEPDASLDLPWLGGEWREMLKLLPTGFSFNTFAKYHTDKLPPLMREKWEDRSSELPFSMHCPYRLAYDVACPTLWGSCQYVHPKFDRLLTIRELSIIMGWDGYTPIGPKPIPQIVKGIVPAVGCWLAEQARLYLDGAWDGADDYASKYNAKTRVFEEALHTDREKVFNLTDYAPHTYEPRAWEWQSDS